MCAINGFNFNDKNLILKMNQVTSHRGPDGTGVFCDDTPGGEAGGISLGHNRLSIIDLSEEAGQPMFSEDNNFVTVFNGEIYNFEHLKSELEEKGYKFFSESDTEVVLKSYQEYGSECVNKFNGIFAFAVWDRQKRELFIARDHVGVKPLYYFNNGGKLIFSSEIKAILEHNISRDLDLTALNHYFRLSYVPCPLTIFKNVKKLPAGCWLKLKDNKIDIQNYWNTKDRENFSSKEEAREKIKNILEDSVVGQVISDRPVGVFLSGGVDSSIILGLVRKFAPSITKTYTTGFKTKVNDEKFNEDFKLAGQTAKHYGTEHRELVIGVEDICENLEKVFWHMDEPNGNHTAPAMSLLSEEAKKEVAVVLGGDGGDELFGGYDRYRLSRVVSRYQKLPVFLQKTGCSVLGFMGKDNYKNKLSAKGAKRITSFMCERDLLLSNILKQGIFRADITDNLFSGLLNKYSENELSSDFEKIFMDVDRSTWLTDDCLMRTDRMSMAHGLELRVPILDYRLVEISQKIPTGWKIKGKQGKMIFREAFGDYILPHLGGHPKTGWFTPMAKWLREEPLRSFAEEALGSLPEEYFQKENISKIFEEHLSYKVYNLNIIWRLVSFAVWYNIFINKKIK